MSKRIRYGKKYEGKLNSVLNYQTVDKMIAENDLNGLIFTLGNNHKRIRLAKLFYNAVYLGNETYLSELDELRLIVDTDIGQIYTFKKCEYDVISSKIGEVVVISKFTCTIYKIFDVGFYALSNIKHKDITSCSTSGGGEGKTIRSLSGEYKDNLKVSWIISIFKFGYDVVLGVGNVSERSYNIGREKNYDALNPYSNNNYVLKSVRGYREMFKI